MKWNFERSEKTDQECPHCGLFYSDRGIKAHRANCPLKGTEYFVRRPDSADVDSGGDPPEDGGPPTEPESSDDVGPDPSSHTHPPEGDTHPPDDGNPEPATTDGGRRAPPMPEIDVDDSDDDRDVLEELPDRFVPVDEYVAEVNREIGSDHADELAQELEGFDVVDVVATDETTVVAYPLEEVEA